MGIERKNAIQLDPVRLAAVRHKVQPPRVKKHYFTGTLQECLEKRGDFVDLGRFEVSQSVVVYALGNRYEMVGDMIEVIVFECANEESATQLVRAIRDVMGVG